MFKSKTRLVYIAILSASVFILQGCDNGNQSSDKKVEIKPAPKLTNDATAYANKAWTLINTVDPLVYGKQLRCVGERNCGKCKFCCSKTG